MKKTLAYLFLIVTAFVACKDTPKNNAEDEAKKLDEQRIQTTAKCYEAAKAYLIKANADDTLLVIDSISLGAIDTATEKMGKENVCQLALETKEAIDNYVEKQTEMVQLSAKVSPILAEPEQKELDRALLKQKVAEANYTECIEALKTTDATDYKYYQVTVDVIKTKRNITDTIQQKVYVDKETFEVKLF